MKPNRMTQSVIKEDGDNRLQVLHAIEPATPLDQMNVSLRLTEMAKLEDGWLDGKGRAAAKENLDWLANSFDTWFDADLPLPYHYPTAEGGVQAEWSLGDWEVSLDIDLESRQAAYQALSLTDKACAEATLTLNTQEGWGQLNSALKQIANRRAEESLSGI